MTSSSDPLHTAGPTYVQRAAEQLKGRTRTRAVEIADDVLRNAMSAHRRSLPVRAHPSHDFVRISDQVIIATLRRRIDAALPSAAVGRIYLLVDRHESLQELTIELFARYGEVLLEVADQARLIADRLLTELLGQAESPVSILISHVHVSDITVGDPHFVDPTDE